MAIGRERARISRSLATAAVFAVVLVMPALETLFGLDRTPPPQEKRQLATIPGTPKTLNALASFPGAFDAYLGDHFGFRPLLIRLHARVAVRWLGVAPSPAVEVIVGKKGWLYFTGDDALASIEGRNLLSESELAAWTRALRQRGRWLERRGSHYLIVVPPDKGTIYPEYLPGWVRPTRHGTRLDQLLNALRGCPEVTAVDLRPAVRAYKRLTPVYTASDTHWTAAGAYAAYDATVSALERWFPRARPAPPASFNLAWATSDGGDLALMTDTQGLVKERLLWISPKAGVRSRTVPPGDYVHLRPWPALQDPVVTVCDDGDIPRAVIFRDSFFPISLFSEHFGRAVYLWIDNFEAAVIEREEPDLVIQEVAERLLGSLDLANPPEVAAVSVKPGQD
jgi:alginate O-acetyltransferase complex protein AlgJ